MRNLIEKIVDGDNDGFEALMNAIADGKIFAFAQEEDAEGLSLNFLDYALEDDEEIEYIPVFTDEKEVEDFLEDADLPEGYELYEFEGELFADLIDPEQFVMINPVSGGIVFQGAHLKALDADEDEEPGDQENKA